MVKKLFLYFYFIFFIILLCFFEKVKISSPVFFTGLFSSIILTTYSFKRDFRNFGFYPVSKFKTLFRFFFSFLFFFFLMGFISELLSFLGSSFLTLQPIVFSILLIYLSHFLYNKLPTGVPFTYVIKRKFLPPFFLIFIFSEGILFFAIKFLKNYIFFSKIFNWIFLFSGIFIFISQLVYYRKNFVIKGLKSYDMANLKPLLVLGVDAADWRFLTPLIFSKEKSFFKDLIEKGIALPLDTFGRRLSPIIWTSIATGVKKEKHGITGFINPESKGKMELFKSFDIRKPPFWLMANERGMRSGVLNWMMNYPAYMLDGFMIGRFDNLEDEKNFYPEEIKEEFEGLKSSKKCEEEKIEEKWLCERDRDLALLEKILEKTLLKLEEENIDILALYTNLTDDIMHKFYQFYESDKFDPEKWHYLEEDVGKYKDVILNTYSLLDDIFFKLIDLEKYNMVLISDHGARARSLPLYSFDIEKFLRDLSIKKLEVVDNTIWNDHIDLRFIGEVDENDKKEILKTLSMVKTESGKKIFSNIELVNDGLILRIFHSYFSRFPYGEKLFLDERILNLDDYLKFINVASGNHDSEGVFIGSGENIRNGFTLPLLIDNPLSKIINIGSLEERLSFFLNIFTLMRATGFLNPITTIDVTPLITTIKDMSPSVDFDYNLLLNIFEVGISENLLKGEEYFSEIYIEMDEEDNVSDEIYKKRLRDLGYIE